MSRVKNSVATRARRKRVLKLAKGYFGRKSTVYKTANQAVIKSAMYAYRDRRNNKRNFRKLWITRINEKIIVVAPTTAVPIKTGFEVALKVLPAPSFSSRYCLAFSKSGLKPYSFSISSDTLGISSIKDNS